MAERLRFPDAHAYAAATRRARQWAEQRLAQTAHARAFRDAIAAESRAGKRAPRWAVAALLTFMAAGVCWSLYWIL